jgi:hypothetical protein
MRQEDTSRAPMVLDGLLGGKAVVHIAEHASNSLLPNSAWEGDRLSVGEGWTVDRFFPNCILGLVEVVARARWGVPDLKKAWFGLGLEYTPPRGGKWLSDNGIEFSGRFDLTAGTRERAFARLRALHGIELEKERLLDERDVLRRLVEILRAGFPVLTTFDMSVLQLAGRAEGLFQPHFVGVVGYDGSHQRLEMIDQVKGAFSVNAAELATIVRRFEHHNEPFYFVHPRRVPSFSDEALDPRTVKSELSVALANLRSSSPVLGLRAIENLARDVEKAIESEGRPFAIPGIWIVSHDRHALAEQLPYWEQCGVISSASGKRLRSALEESFYAWFEVDMAIELSLYELSAQLMSEVPPKLRAAARTDAAMSLALESVLEPNTPRGE